MGTLINLINRGIADEGYIEKASNADLDSKTANKGINNYTKYSRDVNSWGLMGCQGQPWCCTMQFALEGYEFGVETALKHWNMTRNTYVGYNCFSTYNTFKNAEKVGIEPQLGAVVIFDFSHAGRVIKIYSKNGQKYWDCLEGNTSSNLSDRNGGQVKIKTRPWRDSTVKGFCYIDYEIEKKSGWLQEDGGWRFYNGDSGLPIRNDWLQDTDGKWYWFNGAGIMITNTWYQYNGNWYYLGVDGAMCTSQLVENSGKIYAVDADGKMVTGEIVLSTLSDGALVYKGLSK